jgi:hypothetical protein
VAASVTGPVTTNVPFGGLAQSESRSTASDDPAVRLAAAKIWSGWESAWAFHRAWPEAGIVITPDSGHSAFDPPNSRALVAAADKFGG